jgi:hypothetical protein
MDIIPESKIMISSWVRRESCLIIASISSLFFLASFDEAPKQLISVSSQKAQAQVCMRNWSRVRLELIILRKTKKRNGW